MKRCVSLTGIKYMLKTDSTQEIIQFDVLCIKKQWLQIKNLFKVSINFIKNNYVRISNKSDIF